jgi:Flp pilus assembly protein TadG
VTSQNPTHRPRSLCGDGGSAVVEAAILIPVFILFLAGLLVASLIRHTADVIGQAAADAARQASIARSAPQARTTAMASTLATLRQAGLHCTPQLTLDLSGFARPVGQPASVTARIACTVRLSDITAGTLPGSRTITKSFRSPLDVFRARDNGFTNSEGSSAANPSTGGAE